MQAGKEARAVLRPRQAAGSCLRGPTGTKLGETPAPRPARWWSEPSHVYGGSRARLEKHIAELCCEEFVLTHSLKTVTPED